MRPPPITLAAAAALWLAGCADQAVTRAEHAEAHLAQAALRARDALPARPLTREELIAIALRHNLAVESAEIDEKIARIQRDIAFAAFLPQVSFTLGRSGYDSPVVKRFEFGAATGEAPIQDRYISLLTWDFLQPVFAPYTWFLFAIRLDAADAAAYTKLRVRQLIVTQVSALYYRILGLEAQARSLDVAVAGAAETARQAEALSREGVLTAPELAEARLARERLASGAATVARALEVSRAALLDALGLGPFTEIALAPSPPPPEPPLDLAELTYEALTRRPELFAADRAVAIGKKAAMAALAKLLPVVNVAASFMDTSDSLTKYQRTWYYGISAVVNVFEGFKTINEYREATAAGAAAETHREELYLTIMLQVLEAHREQQRTREAAALARTARQIAAERLAQARARHREGVTDLAALLAAEAVEQEAAAQDELAAFQHRLATVTLSDVAGLTRAEGDVP